MVTIGYDNSLHLYDYNSETWFNLRFKLSWLTYSFNSIDNDDYYFTR